MPRHRSKLVNGLERESVPRRYANRHRIRGSVFISNSSVIKVGLNVEPVGAVPLSIVEHQNKRVGHLVVPITKMGSFDRASGTRPSIDEADVVRGLDLKLDASVLDFSWCSG